MGAAAEIHANSTNSIQAAVNSAGSGDVIIVAPGTYKENVVISDKMNLLIRSSTGPADTIVTANNSSFDVISIQGSGNITVQGLNISGAGLNRAGVSVRNSINCKVKDNILHDNALGVYPYRSDYTVISNNTLTKDFLAGQGRAVIVEYSNYSIVSGNTASNNNHGMSVSGSNGVNVSENTVSLSLTNGMFLENATNITVQNNDVSSSGSFGIYLSSSSGNFIRNNTVFNSTNNGINLVLSPGNEVSNNTVSNPSVTTNTHAIFLNTSHNNNIRSNGVSNNEYGIAMRYSNNNSVLNNTASGNNRGIYIAYTSSLNTLSGNQVYSNSYSGIVLDNAANNNIVNNIVRLNNGSTSYGIVLGGASNNNLVSNTVSLNRRGIYISSSSSGNTVSGNAVSSNTGHGILLENTGINNNLTSNTVSSNGGYGIYLVNSNNTYVLNNVAPNNDKGIYVTTSYNSIVSNNTASNNVNDGIMLSLSDNNTISGNTVYNDTYGISLNSSKGNNISGNRMTWSRNAGIFLCAQSRNNLIFNNYLNNTQNVNNKNNASTWNVTKTSGKNIAGGSSLGGNYWGSPIVKNGHSQIYANNDTDGDGLIDIVYTGDNLTDYLPLLEVYVPEPVEPVYPVANFTTNATSGKAPLSVLFTDLSQNATGWNWNFGDETNSTDRNTTHTYSVAGNYTVNLTVNNANGTSSKTALIYVLPEQPGPNPGGNNSSVMPVADFSTSVAGGYAPLSVVFTDLSQNATSRAWDVNNDGIVDSTNATFVYEYGSAGTYTAKLTAINANGTNSKSVTITVDRRSSGGSSGGGGGGGGGSPEPARNVEVKELSQTFITNGKEAMFNFTKNATCVVYVGFDAKKTVGKTTTIVEQLKNKSTLVSPLSEGEVYKYFNIWVGNSGFASPKNIDNPKICFKVEKSWLQNKGIDQGSITLNRYSNKTWEKIPASFSGEDSKYVYFTADVPGFSFFAITGEINASPEETVTEIEPEGGSDNSEGNTEDTGSEAGQEPDEEESPGMPGFEMVYGIAGLFAAFRYKRK